MQDVLLRFLPLGAAIALLAAVASAFSLVALADRTDENRRALLALCALQDDLERRIEAGQQFLLDHPDGIPGIPRTTIEQSLANQAQTLNAIGPYLSDCPRPANV